MCEFLKTFLKIKPPLFVCFVDLEKMMRRFFSFKSNSYEDNSKTPPLPAGKDNYQKFLEGDAAFSGSRTPDESVSKSRKRYADEQDFSNPRLRRSLSFSSPAPFHYTDESDSNFCQNFNGPSQIYQKFSSIQ